MVKCIGPCITIVSLLIIMTSGSVVAQDTLLTSAAKVIRLKKQMVEDVRPLTKNLNQLKGLTKMTSTLKSLKSELEKFIGIDNKRKESHQSKLAFKKVTWIGWIHYKDFYGVMMVMMI